MLKITPIIIFLLSFIFSSGQVWHNMADYPVLGSCVDTSGGNYVRLPDSLETQVRKGLWDLGRNSAGLSIRFATDAQNISARWTSLNSTKMSHMSPTGIRGLDLYMLQPDNTWAYVGSALPSLSKEQTTATIAKGMPKQTHEYMLFLSLYDGVKDLSIGTEKGAKVTFPSLALPERKRPVVMYGTSILQGGCASRPGMAHTNILQRKLNREVINLGFSGNGHLDPEIARMMAAVDASVYVIDVVPNNTAASLREKLPPFYDILRLSHPNTPIVLIENPLYARSQYDTSYRNGIRKLNGALREFYDTRLNAGDYNLFYVDGIDILGEEGEGTVDGIHLTDLGFSHFADSLYPLLNALIAN